jgi:hypothetical protein
MILKTADVLKISTVTVIADAEKNSNAVNKVSEQWEKAWKSFPPAIPAALAIAGH